MPDILTLTALRALVAFSDPQISPDGTRVAYVRSTQNRLKDRFDATLVVETIANGLTRTVAVGRGLAHPRWSPDGTRLAFLRGDAANHDQIFVSSVAGRPRAVTAAPNGVKHFAWSPDATRLAYDTPDDDPRAAAVKSQDDLFDLGDDGMLTDSFPTPSHLWLVPANGGQSRRLTHGPWSVFEGVAPFAGTTSDPAWTPDGRHLFFTRIPDAHTAVTDRTTIAEVDVATGNVHERSRVTSYEYEPVVAPDGNHVAYLRPHGPGPISVLDTVLASTTSGTESDITPAFDRDISLLRWTPHGSLVAIAVDHLHPALYTFAPGSTPQRVDLGSLVPSDVSIARNGTMAVVASAWSRPSEVYIVRPGTAPRPITHANAALAARAYGRPETLTWTAPNGQRSEGILVHPAGEVPGKKYPLVVWMHGGPEAAISYAWDEGTDEAFPLGAYEAGRGAFVLMPNYRGSDDLGTAHEHGIFGDPGAGPASDIIAGVDAVLARAPIDTSRMCVGGHSYGGYMTAWLIGHDQRWKCAVVADGALDMVSAYNLSGTGNLAFTRDSIGGSPWNPAFAKAYHDGSPITYASAIRTPTLIITGLSDDVVPYVESFSLYHAIKEQHVPVRLVGIPTAHHTPRDPVRKEAYERTIFTYLAGALH